MALLGSNFDEETHKQFANASEGRGGASCTQDDHAKVIRFNVEAVKLHIQKWINDPKCTGKFTGIDELQEAADSKDVNGNLLLRKGQMIFEEVTVSHHEGEDGTFKGWIYDTFAPLLTLAKTKQSRKFAYFHVAIYVGTYLGQHYVVENGGHDGNGYGTIMPRRFEEAFSQDSRFFVCSPPKDEFGKSTRYFVWQKALASIGVKYTYHMKAVSCESFATAMLGSIDSRDFGPIQAAVIRGHKKDLPPHKREQMEWEHKIKFEKFHNDLRKQIALVPVGIKLTLDYFMNTKDTNTDIRWLNRMVRSIRDLMMAAKDAPWFNQMARSYEALMKAAKDGKTEQCKSLLEMGLDVTSHNEQGDTPLLLATRHGHIKTCEEILKVAKGADLNQLLIQAAGRGSPDLCQLLINNGADSNFKSTGGQTALMIAAEEGMTDTCKALIAARATVDAVDKYGWTALMYAARKGRTDTCMALIAAGATVDAVDECGRTALMKAAIKGSTDTCKALIAAGATVDAVDRNELTALMIAAREGSTDTCKALIATGADPNILSTHGRSALVLAAKQGKTKICKILVESGADPNIGRSFMKRTALMCAADEGYAGIYEILLEAGADVDAVDRYGETALMIAAIKGRTVTCKALIAAGADPNILSTHGRSALVLAAFQGNTEICKFLVESGADPNIGRGNMKRTALMWAADDGYTDICEILIEAGADVCAVDEDGNTALALAKKKKHDDCIKVLIKNEVK